MDKARCGVETSALMNLAFMPLDLTGTFSFVQEVKLSLAR
jgi:hypothetical protein